MSAKRVLVRHTPGILQHSWYRLQFLHRSKRILAFDFGTPDKILCPFVRGVWPQRFQLLSAFRTDESADRTADKLAKQDHQDSVANFFSVEQASLCDVSVTGADYILMRG
jgi:hypothetical protein